MIDCCNAYSALITERVGDGEYHFEDGTVSSDAWDVADKYDDEFVEEVRKVINDQSVHEADKEFTPEILTIPT
jgi:hypothetical protein